jgi:hypothetical protein
MACPERGGAFTKAMEGNEGNYLFLALHERKP